MDFVFQLFLAFSSMIGTSIDRVKDVLVLFDSTEGHTCLNAATQTHNRVVVAYNLAEIAHGVLNPKDVEWLSAFLETWPAAQETL